MKSPSLSDHLALLVRARDTLARHVQTTSKDRPFITDLETEIARIRDNPMPWPVTVYLAHITYSHGICTFAAPTHRVLMAEIARFCRSQWDQISYDRDPATIDDPTTVHEYFHRHPEDHLHSCTIPIHPDTATDVNALEIGRHLTLSTRHLPWTTTLEIDKWIELDPSDRPIAVADTHYGWFVATKVLAHDSSSTVPDDLLVVLRFAQDNGCNYVLFDRDGPFVDGLRVYEW